MLLSDFQFYFFLRTSKKLKNGHAPIYLRLELRGARKDISTKLSCDPHKWNTVLKMVNGSTTEEKQTNSALMEWQKRVKDAVESLNSTKDDFDLSDLKSYLEGERMPEGLLQFFQSRIDEMEALIGKGYQKATLTNYRSCQKHLKSFIRTKFRRTEIPLKSLNYSFLDAFLSYIKVTKNCQTNTANKYLRCLRAVLYEAKKRQLINQNPFENFSLKYDRTSREFLNEIELKSLIEKEFKIVRIAQVRDIFLFSCYTGLAYVDVKSLTKEHIVERNGSKWIIKPRTKSKIESMIPLLPQAERILHKYSGESKNGHLLPVPSNQKLNSYLKEVADLCEIEKDLTFHMARHTFATTVALNNDVPMESVSRMLGHTSIRTTQVYARVLEGKLLKDTSALMKKFA